jgi:polyhydroxybutyrate depolymerase
MDANSDQEGFIVAYPDGVGSGRYKSWNGGGCCGQASHDNVDDVGFVSALIDHIEAKASIDTDRIYAAGMSNGAMLCHRLGCELSDRIAAIGCISGTILVDSCTPTRPVPIIMIHGTDDTAVPWNGGVGTGIPGVALMSVPATVELWKRVNGCTGPSTAPYMDLTLSGKTYMKAEYQGDSSEGADVVLCTVYGGTHMWPGPVSFIERFVGEEGTSGAGEGLIFSANELLCRFFEEHGMDR